MWRSVFMALGITLGIIGLECLVIEEAVLAKSGAIPAAMTVNPPAVTEIKTREWMPWTFLATGAVIVLYSITLPKRFTA